MKFIHRILIILTLVILIIITLIPHFKKNKHFVEKFESELDNTCKVILYESNDFSSMNDGKAKCCYGAGCKLSTSDNPYGDNWMGAAAGINIDNVCGKNMGEIVDPIRPPEKK